MLQTILVRILLSPFALLYGIVIGIRNVLYDIGFLKGTKFSLPIINIGNLSVGGAGKSPHVEYLISMLKPYINVATLSRGYNRNTKGYKDVKITDSALEVGDEPLMFKKKNPSVTVAVAEHRTNGVSNILMDYPQTHCILLDDAFQHRAIKAGMNILLSNYDFMFTDDYLMPAGRLREWRSAYQRADMIIVTKCPKIVTEEDKNRILRKIKPLKNQMVYFSKYQYYNPYSIYDQQFINLDDTTDVLLLSAIANTDYLKEFVKAKAGKVKTIDFSDHHNFDERDINRIIDSYQNLDSKNKVILTTEKDAMRLSKHINTLHEKQIPVFVLPIQVEFLFNDKEKFEEFIRQFLLNYKI